MNYARCVMLQQQLIMDDRRRVDESDDPPAPPPPSSVFNIRTGGLFCINRAILIAMVEREFDALRQMHYPWLVLLEHNPHVQGRTPPVSRERVRGPWAPAKQRLPPPRPPRHHTRRTRTNAQQRQVYGARKWRT